MTKKVNERCLKCCPRFFSIINMYFSFSRRARIYSKSFHFVFGTYTVKIQNLKSNRATLSNAYKIQLYTQQAFEKQNDAFFDTSGGSFLKSILESMFHSGLNFCRRVGMDSNSLCIQYESHNTQIKKLRRKVGSDFTQKHCF